MMRILHFSDVHFPMTYAGSFWRERMRPKRFLAALNYGLRRRSCFKEAPAKWEAFRSFVEEGAFDAVVCTGDLTASGMSGELASARERLRFLFSHPGFVLMPGNHDVYLPGMGQALFGRYFSDSMRGELIRPEGCAVGLPCARLLGDDVAVVAVDSVKPNPCIWLSSGRVNERQMEWTRELLGHEALRDRFVLVATHYNLDDGDSWRHGLENRAAFREMLSAFPNVGAVLHGHVHRSGRAELPVLNAPAFCAGSLTYRGRESFWVLEWDGTVLSARKGGWDGTRYILQDG